MHGGGEDRLSEKSFWGCFVHKAPLVQYREEALRNSPMVRGLFCKRATSRAPLPWAACWAGLLCAPASRVGLSRVVGLNWYPPALFDF
jgi:hypothetical protein